MFLVRIELALSAIAKIIGFRVLYYMTRTGRLLTRYIRSPTTSYRCPSEPTIKRKRVSIGVGKFFILNSAVGEALTIVNVSA